MEVFYFYLSILIKLACAMAMLKAIVVLHPLLCQITPKKNIKKGIAVLYNPLGCLLSESFALQIETPWNWLRLVMNPSAEAD